MAAVLTDLLISLRAPQTRDRRPTTVRQRISRMAMLLQERR
jgi:hypothetical protein